MTEFQSSPKFPESYWLASGKKSVFPQSVEDMNVDTIIVGAGITGITLAYLLVQEGVKVALIDASTITNGTTGHTTAKITTQHGLIYDKLIHQSGEEKAKWYYEANNEALQFIKETIHNQKISCDFSEQDAYVFTNSDEYIDKVQQEYDAYQKLGIPGEIVEKIPLPIEVKSAIVMKKQAQFHPVNYLSHFIEKIVEGGGIILENSPAMDVEKGDHPAIILKNGVRVSGKKVVLATHYPFYDWKGLYFARLHAERSYVVAATLKNEYPGGLYISADSPKRSIRYTPLENGESLLLIGGESHKTGQGGGTQKYYEALEAYTKSNFDIGKIAYRWSAQDLVTLDDIPYIGNLTADEPSIYVATGYAKWGMTNGTAAALLLRDKILERENRFTELYTPSRFDADPSIKNVVVQNANVAKQLIGGKLGIVEKTVDDLSINEGSVVNVNGKRAGGYKDENGVLHVVDTTCTHLGCEVNWNSGDRSWDCPCHGSRFSFTGEVMEGPAKIPLKKIDID